MTATANAYNKDQVLARAYENGKLEGIGASGPIENAKFLFEAALSFKFTVSALQDFYREYARGKNDGNKSGHQIDLTDKNKKSIEGQASKLAIFPALAGQNGGVHHDLIERTVAMVLAIEGKKPSVYEMVLKAARAQVKGAEINKTDEEGNVMLDDAGEPLKVKIGGARAITDPELKVLVTPDVVENTRITQLERQLATVNGKASLLTDKDKEILSAVLNELIKLAVREEREMKMDAQAADFGWDHLEQAALLNEWKREKGADHNAGFYTAHRVID